MQTLLIVYHSATGGTRQMADAALAGALGEEGVASRMLHAGVDGGAGFAFDEGEAVRLHSGEVGAAGDDREVGAG